MRLIPLIKKKYHDAVSARWALPLEDCFSLSIMKAAGKRVWEFGHLNVDIKFRR